MSRSCIMFREHVEKLRGVFENYTLGLQLYLIGLTALATKDNTGSPGDFVDLQFFKVPVLDKFGLILDFLS